MSSIIIRNATIINEGKREKTHVFIKNGLIHKIGIEAGNQIADTTIDAEGLWLMPGMIDDQVHFREPGLTHKADIQSESRAAATGGITTFMEMPNTKPQTLTQELLERKYQRAREVSAVNFSFFMGASNDNFEEVMKTDPNRVCGVKIFMGSSTGNMLVDNSATLEKLFSNVSMLIATHCEKEEIIRKNLAEHIEKYGDDIPMELHPVIRSREACFESSKEATDLARKHGTRLHILHISTADELALFDDHIPLEQKKITAEACVHHLFFSSDDYPRLQKRIKWNPAVKSPSDRKAIQDGLISGKIDIVATDHAPHTVEEKANLYTKAPSGAPLVQHAVPALLELSHQGIFSPEMVVEKMAHAPAICFQIEKRGFIREGYFADLILVDPNKKWTVSPKNIRYKCKWSPLEGYEFQSKIEATLVNGEIVYWQGKLNQNIRGQRVLFNKN